MDAQITGRHPGEPIMTDRCIILDLGAPDVAAFIDLYSDERVRQFLGGPLNEEKARTRFEKMLLRTDAINCSVRLKETGEFVGLVNIDKHHDGVEYEVSYQLMPKYWGQGLAQEIVKAFVDAGLEMLQRRTLLAETQTANLRSIALLQRIGFQEIRQVTRCGALQSVFEYKCA